MYVAITEASIAILSQGLKILSKIIYNRIEAYCERLGIFKDSQNGFRRQRGRQDMILILRYIQSLFQEKNLNLYLAFIDISKAYDSIQRSLIWLALKKIGLPPKLIKMIQVIYQSMNAELESKGMTLIHLKFWCVSCRVTQIPLLSST